MRKLISFIGVSISLIIIISLFISYSMRFQPTHPIITLDKGWIVNYRNERYINTNLEKMSQQVGYTFSRGDFLTLSFNRKLPPLDSPFSYLCFKTQNCAYEVFLDNELIAARDMDAISDNSFVGFGYNYVPLGTGYAGKKLSIKLYVTENHTRADLVSPILGDFDDLVRYQIHSVLFPAGVGIFLIVFGIVFLVISLLFSFKTSSVTSQIVSSIISIFLGIWVVTAFDLSDFFLNKSYSTEIEYTSLYLMLPYIYLLVATLHNRLDNLLLKLLGYSAFAFSILFLLLHLFNYVHINHFIYPYYLLSLLGFTVLIYYDYLDIKSRVRSASVKISMLGITVLCLCLMAYFLFAIATRYVDYRQSFIAKALIPSGAMFFTLTQLLNYFIFMTKSFAQRKEYASLSQIAYIDNLTGLSNRVSCDKKLSEIDSSEDNFAIISLDLNGLKEVNDNAGHPAGDRLLKSFSSALVSTFDKKGDVFRIGGDEFLVITSTLDASGITALLKELDNKLSVLDEQDPEINHSVSYGFAFRNETDEKDSHTVSMLADKRMYDYKTTYYADMMHR